MSMDRCIKCGDLVDTDEDLDCYIQQWVFHRYEDRCYCESCRDRLFAWCERCEKHVGHDEMSEDGEWCQNCAEAAGDLLHDQQKEAQWEG